MFQQGVAALSGTVGLRIPTFMVANNNNIFMIGYLNDAGTGATTTASIRHLSSGSIATTLGAISGQNRGWMVQYNSSGNLIGGCFVFSNSIGDVPYGLDIDSSGNIIMVTSINTGSGSTLMNSWNGSNSGVAIGTQNTGGTQDVAIIRYNSSGIALQGANLIPNTIAGDTGYTVHFDTSNNVYVSGRYHQTSTAVTVRNFDFTTSTIQLPVVSTGGDMFLLKYNSSGVCVAGANIIQGSGRDTAFSITTDSSNNVYIVGEYTSSSTVTVRHLTGSNSTLTLPSTGTSQHPVVVKYNASGLCEKASVPFTGTSGANGIDSCIFSNGYLYLSGRYTSTSNVTIKNLDGISTSNILSASGTSLYPVFLRLPA